MLNNQLSEKKKKKSVHVYPYKEVGNIIDIKDV